MRAVRYDRFGGIDQLYLADLPEPVPTEGQVLVRVHAAALNPGALPALNGSSYVPARDLAGVVVATADDVDQIAVGDAVLGRLQSWEAHAEFVAMPADGLVSKPDSLSWDVAGSLFTTPMAGKAAVDAVRPAAGELVVVSGASGGVGLVAAQLCVRAGARVVGLAGVGRHALLRRLQIEPVRYGDGEADRIRDVTAGEPPSAVIDTVGRPYVELALHLGVAPERVATVVDYAAAQELGVRAVGTPDAGGAGALSGLAHLASTGALHIPIARTFPLDAVQDAYRALAGRELHGRIVLHPQESAGRSSPSC